MLGCYMLRDILVHSRSRSELGEGLTSDNTWSVKDTWRRAEVKPQFQST